MTEMRMRTGLIGLGKMGNAIALRLAQAGLAPLAWDSSETARERALDAGIALAANPRAVADQSEMVIISITADSGVRDLFTGPGGFLEGEVKGKLFVEMSTLRPETVRTLAPLLRLRGAAILDMPVLGSIPAVREGRLVGLAGGDVKDLERARPVMEQLTRSITYMGPSGSGHAMKLAVNLIMANYLQSVGEAMALGEAHGLARDLMLDVIANSALSNAILAGKLEMLRGGEKSMTLDIRTLRKDAQSALAAGTGAGLAMPATAGALDALAAANAAGWGARDIGELVEFMLSEMGQKGK